jgi:hypothetical protein
MKQVREIINRNKNNFEHFEYYLLLLEKIEENMATNPDISIETCKSLIEGVSKTIIRKLDNTLSDRDIEKLEAKVAFKLSLNKIAEKYSNLEDSFITRVESVVQIVNEIRNKRGDISHGRVAPKVAISDISFSKLVEQITEGIVVYLLDIFFSLELPVLEPIKYEDNEGFNISLNEENPLRGVIYSKALFEQDYTMYLELLDEFKLENE